MDPYNHKQTSWAGLSMRLVNIGSGDGLVPQGNKPLHGTNGDRGNVVQILSMIIYVLSSTR